MFRFLLHSGGQWISNLLAMDEKRLSTVIVITIFFCIVAAVQVLKFRLPMDPSVREIIITCLYIVGGVNVFSKAADTYSETNKNGLLNNKEENK